MYRVHGGLTTDAGRMDWTSFSYPRENIFKVKRILPLERATNASLSPGNATLNAILGIKKVSASSRKCYNKRELIILVTFHLQLSLSPAL